MTNDGLLEGDVVATLTTVSADRIARATPSADNGFPFASPASAFEKAWHANEAAGKPNVGRRSSQFSLTTWGMAWICLGTGIAWFLSHNSAIQPRTGHNVASATRPRTPLTTPIAEIQIGQRVLAQNPLRSEEEAPPFRIDRPSTWRVFTWEKKQSDGSVLRFELLRELREFGDAGQQLDAGRAALSLVGLVAQIQAALGLPGRNVTNVAHLTLAVGVALAPDKTSLPIVDSTLIGRTFNLDVPALGPPGPATIVALRPCPPIEAGPGRVVTGWFRHPSAATIDLVVDVEKRPLGTTDNHPFWSEDRHAFVPAGELRVGETLRTASGNQTHVIAKTTRGVTEDVFNLEVEGMHTYFVGDKGVLVHNKGDLITGPIKEAGEKLANSHTRSDDTKKMWQALKALWKGQPQVASAGNPLPANDAPPPGGALWYQTQVLTVLNRFTTAPFSQTGARPGFNSDAVGALQSLIVLIEKGNSP